MEVQVAAAQTKTNLLWVRCWLSLGYMREQGQPSKEIIDETQSIQDKLVCSLAREP